MLLLLLLLFSGIHEQLVAYRSHTSFAAALSQALYVAEEVVVAEAEAEVAMQVV